MQKLVVAAARQHCLPCWLPRWRRRSPSATPRRRRIFYNGAGSAPRISMIGDSTIAALRWTNQFEPLKRFNFTYDAESCRRTVLPSCRGREGYAPDTTLNAMRRLSGRLGSVLCIMGGYDDPSYNFGAAVDAVMAEAARQGIPTVMWLTLRIQRVLRRPRGDLVQRARSAPSTGSCCRRRCSTARDCRSPTGRRTRPTIRSGSTPTASTSGPPGPASPRRTSPTKPTVCSPARSSHRRRARPVRRHRVADLGGGLWRRFWPCPSDVAGAEC